MLAQNTTQNETTVFGASGSGQSANPAHTFSDAEEAEMANADIDTQLRHAAETGNVEKVRQLLAIPEINVNACDENGCTPLYEASHEGHAECVRLLLAVPYIDVNKSRTYGMTPLLEAIENNHPKCVELLLTAPGIDVNKGDVVENAKRDLHSLTINRFLAGMGASIPKNTYKKHGGETPLLMAAANGHAECMKLLLQDARVDVNRQDRDGETALYMAAANGHASCVRLLLSAPGVDVNMARMDGNMPLPDDFSKTACGFLDAMYKNVYTITLCHPGFTPLMAAAANDHLGCLNLLLSDKRVDVNKCDVHGNTALSLAKKNGNTDCVQRIREHPECKPCIRAAIKRNKTKLFYLLLLFLSALAIMVLINV